MDIGLQRLAVIGLILIALFSVIGVVILAVSDDAVPDVLVALSSAAVGAIAGLITGGSIKASDYLPGGVPAQERTPMQPTTVTRSAASDDVPPWMSQTH